MTKVAMKKIKNRIGTVELPLKKAGKRSFNEIIEIVKEVQKKIESDPEKYLSRSEMKKYGCIL